MENSVEVDETDLSFIFSFLFFFNLLVVVSFSCLLLFQLIVSFYSFGVKSILDYSVEVDEAEDAKKEEKKSWTFKKVNKWDGNGLFMIQK